MISTYLNPFVLASIFIGTVYCARRVGYHAWWRIVDYGMRGISKTIIFGHQLHARLAPFFQPEKKEEDEMSETFLVEFIRNNASVLDLEIRVQPHIEKEENEEYLPSVTFLSATKPNRAMECQVRLASGECCNSMWSFLNPWIPEEYDFYLITRWYHGECTTKIKRRRPTSLWSFLDLHILTTATPIRTEILPEDKGPIELHFHRKGEFNFLLMDNVFDHAFMQFFMSRYMGLACLPSYHLSIIDDSVNIHRFSEKDVFGILFPSSTNDSRMFFGLETAI